MPAFHLISAKNSSGMSIQGFMPITRTMRPRERSVALLCKIKEWNQEPSYAAKVKIIWEWDTPECRYRLPR